MRPIIGQPHFAGIMLTIGMAFSIRGITSLVWGPEERGLPTPLHPEDDEYRRRAGAGSALAIAAGTLVLCVALLSLLPPHAPRHGDAGHVAEPARRLSMAIPVKSRVHASPGRIAAAVSGIAGLLIAPLARGRAQSLVIVLKGFGAAVLGGFGSIPGALVGGVLIGVAEQFVGVYVDPSA